MRNNTQQYTTIHDNSQQYTTIQNNTQQYTKIHNNKQQYNNTITTMHNNAVVVDVDVDDFVVVDILFIL